ncbi:MAG: phage tail tape measure protein [Campylobacterota bacterium]|nr:phage tail tape measure protein [Campylobacterota bacterium]
MAQTEQEILIRVRADADRALREIDSLNRQVTDLSRTSRRTSADVNTLTTSFSNLGTSIATAAAGLASYEGVSKVVTTLADFEVAMKKLKVVSGATADEFKLLEEAALDMGENTSYSATQAAEGLNFLAMAGFNAEDAITSMPSVINLATVGSIELARASDIASDSLTAFGMEAEEMEGLVDVMAKTITSSNTTVEQLGEAFKKVAPISATMGVSVEETASALSVMADAGIKAEMAGTNLKIALLRLSTDKGTAEALKELGIEAYNAEGNFKGIVEITKELKPALARLDETSRNIKLKEIYGSEAIASGAVMVAQVETMEERVVDLTNASGVSSSMATEMSQTLTSAWGSLGSAIEALVLTTKGDLTPALTDAVKAVTEVVKGTRAFYDENEALIDTIATLTAALVATNVIMKILFASSTLAAIGSMALSVTSLTAAAVALRTALLSVVAVNPMFVALGVAISGATYYINEMEASTNRLADANEKVDSVSIGFKNTLKELVSTYNSLSKTFDMTSEKYDKLGESTGKQIANIDEEIKRLKSLKNGSEEYKSLIAELNLQKQTLIKTYQRVSDNLNLIEESTEKVTKATIKEAETVKMLSDEHKKSMDKIKSDYESRREKAEDTVNKIVIKERKLKDEIAKLEAEINDIRKDYADKREMLSFSTDEKIAEINAKSLDDYGKYLDNQKRADEAYSLAKEAIKNGDATKAREYLATYDRLVAESAGEEIKVGEDVRVSKAATSAEAIKDLNAGKDLMLSIYDLEEQAEIDNNTQKINNKKLELDALKLQFNMQKALMEQMAKIISLATGKKFEMDFTKVNNEIKAYEKALTATTTKKRTLEIETKADTKEAEKELDEFEQEEEKEPIITIIRTEMTQAQKDLVDFKKEGGEPITSKQLLDAEQANKDIDAIQKKASKTNTSKQTVDDNEARADIDSFQKEASKSNTSKQIANTIGAVREIREFQALATRNTSSTHTVYVKRVETRATGGEIGHFAGGGGYKKLRGKIAGHDLTGADDVPAMLTRGEFVQKVAAVDYYGTDFMNALNNMQIPKSALHLAEGGAVDNSQNGKTVNLNLTMPTGESFSMMSDEDVAMALERHMRKNY